MAGKGRGWKSPAEFMLFLQTAEFMESGAAVSESPALAICIAALKAAEKRQSSNERVDIDSNPGTPTAH